MLFPLLGMLFPRYPPGSLLYFLQDLPRPLKNTLLQSFLSFFLDLFVFSLELTLDTSYILFISLACLLCPLEYQFHDDRGFGFFCLLMHLQCPDRALHAAGAK